MRDQDVAFALKVIKKKHVVDNRQEEHIHSERKILAEARSPFVVKSVPSSSPPGWISCFLVIRLKEMVSGSTITRMDGAARRR